MPDSLPKRKAVRITTNLFEDQLEWLKANYERLGYSHVLRVLVDDHKRAVENQQHLATQEAKEKLEGLDLDLEETTSE